MHDHRYGGRAKTIQLWSPERQQWENALNWTCTADWEKDGENKKTRDFGAIKSSIASTAYLGMEVVSDDVKLSRCGLTIAGYASDKQREGPQMVRATCMGCQPRAEDMDYTVDTMPGESGAPVMTRFSDGTIASLGIHNYGDKNATKDRYGRLWGRKNTATRITRRVLQEIQEWIRTL